MVVIIGGEGNDNLVGTDFDDEIDGRGGDDEIFGLGGNDTIDGGAGDDTINGGAGDDTLFSGAGNDALFGGSGNDRMVQDGSGSQTYDGGEGTDTYEINLSNFNLDSSRVIEVNMITGYSGLQGDTTLSDTIANFENINLSTATNAVLITGDSGNNELKGGAGDDTINGGDGTDIAIFSGLSSEYSVQETGKDLIITDNQAGRDGVDSLFSIETLQFSNGVAQLTDLVRPEDIDRGIYRFFNVDTGTHFLSGSTVERDSVINNLDSFNFEGPAFRAADPTNAAADTVFRFFNTQTGTHFFTQSTVERDNILDTIPQFSFEGEAYKGYTEQVDGSIPLYRFFNTQTGTHFYTAAEAEKDSIVANLPTFNFEGTAYWVDPVLG